jgi:hypothetical protein
MPIEKSIEDWCKEFNIKEYEIKDSLVNVNGDVNLTKQKLSKIPIKFGVVEGYFSCNFNHLKTLEGVPIKVGGSFHCYHNKLISLEGGPMYVYGHYNCVNNLITSLKGSPIKVSGYFYCSGNPIYEEYIKYDSYQHYMRSVKLKELICKNDQ